MSSSDTVLCPSCQGAKTLHAFVDGRDPITGKRWGRQERVPCFACKGSGTISRQQAAWMEIGAAHRAARVARGESIFAAAGRLGITTVALNAMEQGREDPARLQGHEP